MDAELEVLGELLVEDLEVVLLLSDLVEQLKGPLDDVLLDQLDDPVLLKGLTRDVQRKVIRIDDTLEEVQPLRNEILAVVHDEHTPHVQLDVVQLLLRLGQVIRGPPRDEQADSETNITLDPEVLDSKVLLPVVADALVELGILVLGDLRRGPHPQRLVLVDEFPLVLDGRHLLLLLFLLLGLVDLLDLVLTFLLLLLLLVLVVGHLGLLSLLDVEGDRVADELGVLLDQLLEPLLLEELAHVLLQVQVDLCAPDEVLAAGVPPDGEVLAGLTLPDVLVVIAVVGGDDNAVGDKEG